ncbi:MAG: type II toxin-antitoxin system VapC family toxin [Candidatus Methanofastidiosia archaeon]
MMVLVDTNIFLEILLGQHKEEDCKGFLEKNTGNLHITDFSLHSIGIAMFRYSKEEVFGSFMEDVLSAVMLLSLPIESYGAVIDSKKNLGLDFDDAYQYCVARHYELKIVTMDRDFEIIKDVDILFL